MQRESKCSIIEYQKGYQIYGWVNCYDDSYQKALANKEEPLLYSITTGIAYKIDAQTGTLEILEQREEGILFSSENKIVYINDGKILCHEIHQDSVKEITSIDLYYEQPVICFKKDIIILYDENAEASIIRY